VRTLTPRNLTKEACHRLRAQCCIGGRGILENSNSHGVDIILIAAIVGIALIASVPRTVAAALIRMVSGLPAG
jgi:hypothetical protein